MVTRMRTAHSCAGRWALVIVWTPHAAPRRCDRLPTRTCSTPVSSGSTKWRTPRSSSGLRWRARRAPTLQAGSRRQRDHGPVAARPPGRLRPRDHRALAAERPDSRDRRRALRPCAASDRRASGRRRSADSDPPRHSAPRRPERRGRPGRAPPSRRRGPPFRVLRGLLPEAFGYGFIFDTLALARILLPTYESHSLPLLSRRLGISHERPHRGLSDARATGDLFRILVGAGRTLPEATLVEMRRVASQAPGALDAFLNDVVLRSALDAIAPVDHAVASATPPALRPAGQAQVAPDRRSVGEAAAALLGPDGPLAAREGYEYREAQVQMAMAIG